MPNTNRPVRSIALASLVAAERLAYALVASGADPLAVDSQDSKLRPIVLTRASDAQIEAAGF